MNRGRAPVSHAGSAYGWAGAAASLLLHLSPLMLLLPHDAARPGVALADPPVIEIEMVDQAEQTKGRPPANAGQPPTPEPQPPAPPPQTEATTGSPPPPPPAPPMPPRPAPAGAPAVNLGDADDDQQGLRVTGDNVVPPRPDALFRNKPPAYPVEAARRRREGTVLVRARIGTAGVPEAVEVGASSGDASLDRAALEAVQLWRFEPARTNGLPVPFDYEVNIRFKLGER